MGLIKEVGEVRNRALLLLFTALIFLLTISSVSALPINLTNLVPISDVYPINSTTVWATVLFNFTTAHGPGTTNVTNATFFLNSSTNVITNIGTNTTENLTFYSIKYDTTSVADGNYTLIINISNKSGNALPSTINGTLLGLGNFSIDNTGPTIAIATIRNQTNISGYGDTVGSLINVTVTPEIGDSIQNCTFAVNGTSVNGSIVGSTLNGTFSVWNWTVVQLNLSHGFYTSNLTCDENAKDLNLRRGPPATLLSNQFIVDLQAPFFKMKFKDSAGNEQDEFDFGEAVSVDCEPDDKGVGITSMTINVSMRRPGIGTFNNISQVVSSGAQSSIGEVTIPGSETRELGNYIVQCFIMDALGTTNRSYENSTNRTFTIKVKPPLSTSAFGIPGFQKPIADKVIGVGVINNIGEISETGEARLIAEKGGVIITIDGMEHTITVDSVSDEAANLLVDGSEAPFNSGDAKQFDLNSDNTNELEITLNMIYHKKADLIFKRIALQAAPSTEPPTQPTTTQPPGEVEEEKKSSIIISGLIILIVVVLILVILHFVRKRGGDNVKFRPKDLGAGREEFYTSPPPSKTQQDSGPPPF